MLEDEIVHKHLMQLTDYTSNSNTFTFKYVNEST